MTRGGKAERTKCFRILVVEHHPIIARYLRIYLELYGHQVCSAVGVNAAREVLNEGGVDVMVTDVYLGTETCFSILRDHTAEPQFVVTMSGFDLLELERRQSRSHRWPHLTKPFPPEDLLVLLAEFSASAY